jgi:hypothetical protein
MASILIAAASVVAGILFWHLGRRPHKNRRKLDDSLAEFFETLLFDGRENAHLFIEVPAIQGGFLQFVKVDSRRLQSDFPDAPWSRNYFEAVKACAQKLHLDPIIESTGRSDTTRFLRVCFSDANNDAELFVRCVITNGFGLPPSTPINLLFENVAVRR